MNRKSYDRTPMIDAPSVKELSDLVGIEQAGHLLGLGYSTVSRYRSQGKAPKAVEKAARFELQKRNGKANVPATTSEIFLLRVDPSKVDLLLTFLKGMEIRAIRVKE